MNYKGWRAVVSFLSPVPRQRSYLALQWLIQELLASIFAGGFTFCIRELAITQLGFDMASILSFVSRRRRNLRVFTSTILFSWRADISYIGSTIVQWIQDISYLYSLPNSIDTSKVWHEKNQSILKLCKVSITAAVLGISLSPAQFFIRVGPVVRRVELLIRRRRPETKTLHQLEISASFWPDLLKLSMNSGAN